MPDPRPLNEDDRAELIAYLDGELQGEARRRVENRLVSDVSLRMEADSLKRAWDLLDYLPRSEPSNSFTERTLTLVSGVKPAAPPSPASARFWHGRAPLVAIAYGGAAVLAFILAYALTPGGRPVRSADINPETDVLVTREPTLIDNLPLYLAVENLDYLLALEKSDLFSDDGTGG